MKIKTLSLAGFRNYSKKALDFDSNTSLLLGMNGVGKTNLLEAIYMLATGKSFRAKKEREMILYGQELARVSADVGALHSQEPGIRRVNSAKNQKSKGYSPPAAIDMSAEALEIVVTTGEVSIDSAQDKQRVPKKRYLINGVPKRKMDFVGKLRVVMFRPEDIELVLGSPSTRRDYLDRVLEQVDREYRRSNLSYQKGVRQRNKLLERIREGEAERQQLLFWNKLLIKNGEIISQKRAEFLEFVNNRLKEKKSELQLKYDKSAISESRLEQYAVQEVGAAKTLVGSHRDDFIFVTKRKGKMEKDLSIYGSRGEQRMAVFELKLAELEFMALRGGYELSRGVRNLKRPVLLLDDVFSELDKEHRREVFKLMAKQQTIITTADESLMPKRYLKKVKMVRL